MFSFPKKKVAYVYYVVYSHSTVRESATNFGTGNVVMTLRDKLTEYTTIEEIETYIKNTNNVDKVIVTNFILLKETPLDKVENM